MTVQNVTLALPWKSKDSLLTSDIVIEVLDKICKKKGIKWRIAGEVVKVDNIAVRKIEFSNINIDQNNVNRYQDELKTSIHAQCFLHMVEKIASL